MRPMSTPDAIVVLCSCPDADTADHLASLLVEERLAACVSIVGGVTSIYRWDEKIQKDAEVLLVIKTLASQFTALRDRLADAHPYDLPEIIALPIADGNEP